MAIPDYINPVPPEVYPSSSQDGQAIPLAAVRPAGSIRGTAIGGVHTDINLPEATNIITFYSATAGGIILTEDDENLEEYGYTRGGFVFVPGVMYELVVGEYFGLMADADTTFIVNTLTKWAQLRNAGAYRAS